MKQASTFDVQLSPVCTWCGQAGYQVWCKDMACGQSADMSTSSHRCFLDSQVVHMKQASSFDVQLSPGWPWCGQVGNQVWRNEGAMEKSRVSRTGRSKSTQQKPIADVFSKDLGCMAPFLVMVVTYSCFWLCDCHLLYVWL